MHGRSGEQPVGPGEGGESWGSRQPCLAHGKGTGRAAWAAGSYSPCRVCHPSKSFLRRGAPTHAPLYTPA